MADVWILRLGHRPARDKRVTTHVALAARALGAKGIMVSTKDPELEKVVRGVVKRFGGDFTIKTGVRWRECIQQFEGEIVHLTMYGIHIDDAIQRISSEKVLLVVGAEKVPPEVYQMATYNIAVGNQPHSEVAALAVFLDRFLKGEGLTREFKGRLHILPCERGKRVVNDSD